MKEASFWRTVRTRVPVVVVYHGGNGALAIARTLGRLGVPVYLVAKKDAAPAVQSSRFWKQRFWWDFAAASPRESLEFLLGIGKEIGGRPVLLTLADWIAVFIEQHAVELEERFAFARAREPVIERLGNKWSMFALARELGIPTPQTAYPRSREELFDFLKDARFPVVMKSADPFLPYVPSKAIAESETDVVEKWDADAKCGPPNLILQEYIPGDASSVWMCNAYFTHESQCLAVFTGRKLRQVDRTGVASLAVCEPNDTVAELTRRFMQGAGYAGAVGIGYRYDARDGRYKVLDVNARVSGVFRLFRGIDGLDVVRACYLDLTGQPVPQSAPSPGRKWMLEDDFFAARAQGVRFRDWLQSIRGVQESQWFALDDPVPGLCWAWNQFFARGSSAVKRRKLRAISGTRPSAPRGSRPFTARSDTGSPPARR